MGKVLEICVDSYRSAMNALSGGADRLEVCRDLTVGGLTPSAGFVAAMKKMENPYKKTYTPLSILIRPHGRNFFYNYHEVIEMEEDIKFMKTIGVDGLVFGALDMYENVDKDICRKLLSAANGIPCTFHRAFDVIKDKKKGLEDLIQLGFARVLTSGIDTGDAVDGVKILSLLVKEARGRIIVMPGGDVTDDNILEIVKRTKADEIHSSGRERDGYVGFPCTKKNLCSKTLVENMKTKLESCS